MNSDLISSFSTLEHQRGFDRSVLLKAVETALISAAKKTLGNSCDVRVEIDPKTCKPTVYQRFIVNDAVRGDDMITLEEARKIKPDAELGDTVEKPVSNSLFGRIATQSAKQALNQQLRQAEKDIVVNRYKNRVGELVTAVVRQNLRGDYICDFEGSEAILASGDHAPNDDFFPGDSFRALLVEISSDQASPSIRLSRTTPKFIHALFAEEVSEISEGIVEILNISRDPGFRTKIAVRSTDPKVDPVGACVGIRGNRINNIRDSLNGEKIDIVEWSDDILTFAKNALLPAKVLSISVSEDNPHVIVGTVDSSHYTQAIGKRGQNVRLAGKLLGDRWVINISKDDRGSDIPFEEKLRQAVSHLASLGGVFSETAEILVRNGFLTPEGITALTQEDFVKECELDAEVAGMVWNKAKEIVSGK